MNISFGVTVQGPLLDGSAAGRTAGAIRMGLERLMLRGQAAAQGELYPGHGVDRGNLRRAMYGRMTGDLSAEVGNPLVYAAAINFGWAKGYPGLRGTFAGYHYLEKAQDAVRAAGGPVLVGPIVSTLSGAPTSSEGAE